MQSTLISQTKNIFLKEVWSEWKNKSSFFSIVLLLLVAVFVAYTIFQQVGDKEWHAILYIMLIFGVVQNISRSFLQEKKGLLYYYLQTIDSKAVILGKIVYQMVVNTIFLAILVFLLNFMLPQSITNFVPYLVTIWLFTINNAILFTFTASLAIGTKNSGLMSQILSLPLLIPGLMVSISAASASLMPIQGGMPWFSWIVLLVLIITGMVLSVQLFPVIWKD